MSESMIELMARAMWDDLGTDTPWERAESQDIYRSNASAALAALESAGYVIVPREPKHDPHSGPCPTCGFRIRTVEPEPFIFDEDT